MDQLKGRWRWLRGPATTCRRTGRWASASRSRSKSVFQSRSRVPSTPARHSHMLCWRSQRTPGALSGARWALETMRTIQSRPDATGSQATALPGAHGPPASGLPTPGRRAHRAPRGHRRAPDKAGEDRSRTWRGEPRLRTSLPGDAAGRGRMLRPRRTIRRRERVKVRTRAPRRREHSVFR
jgi:hypothetical protein